MSYSIHLIAREPFAFSFYLERNVLKKTEYNLPMRKMHWKWTWSTWWQFWPGQCRLNTTDVTFSCFIYLFIWFCFLYCVVTIHNAVFVYSKHRQDPFFVLTTTIIVLIMTGCDWIVAEPLNISPRMSRLRATWIKDLPHTQ